MVEIARCWLKNRQHWRVRVSVSDRVVGKSYDYYEVVKLPETASKEEVYRTVAPRVVPAFQRLNIVWLPSILDLLRPPRQERRNQP